MIFELTRGVEAQPVVAPKATVDVPEGFLRALRWAKRFVGSHEKSFPAGTFVHVAGDKLYATNNRHVVEIEIGEDVGVWRLSKADIEALAAFDDEPQGLSVTDTIVAFTWADGRWAAFDAEPIEFDWSTEFKARIDAYWKAGQRTVSPDPNLVDLNLTNSKREPFAFDLSCEGSVRQGRIVAFPQGVFFRQDKLGVSSAIGDGTFDPRIDDVFAEAIAETKATQTAKTKQVGRLLARISAIEKQIADLEADSANLDQKLVDQHAAVAKYQSGDDLDETERALLTPRCDELAAQSRREEVEAEYREHEGVIPDGWEVTDKRLKEDFIYITIKRERVTQKKMDGRIAQKIAKAVSRFFAPSFDRLVRARKDRLGTLTPINPGAG